MELIGAKLPSIDKAEDRELFKQVGPASLHLDDNTDAHNTACCSCLDWTKAVQHMRPIIGCIGLCSDRLAAVQVGTARSQAMKKIGLKTPPSGTASTMDEALKIADEIGNFPLIIRPAFTLGGTGGGIAYNIDEFHQIVDAGLTASLTKQVMAPLPPSNCTHKMASLALSLSS